MWAMRTKKKLGHHISNESKTARNIGNKCGVQHLLCSSSRWSVGVVWQQLFSNTNSPNSSIFSERLKENTSTGMKSGEMSFIHIRWHVQWHRHIVAETPHPSDVINCFVSAKCVCVCVARFRLPINTFLAFCTFNCEDDFICTYLAVSHAQNVCSSVLVGREQATLEPNEQHR